MNKKTQDNTRRLTQDSVNKPPARPLERSVDKPSARIKPPSPKK